MEILFQDAGPSDVIAIMATDGALLLPIGDKLDAASGGHIFRAMEIKRFTGASGQVVDILAPTEFGYSRVLIIGIGAHRNSQRRGQRFGWRNKSSA